MSTAQPLTGKLALITGASKGIGAATALELAALGAKVVINYSSDAAPADALVDKIGRDRAIAIKADVSSVPEIERLVQETVTWGGKIDILIPNAAIAMMRTLEQTTEDEFQRTMDLNVKGPYFLCQVDSHASHTPQGLFCVHEPLTQHRKHHRTSHPQRT
jgi:3-oxoacyl-[acyl-carrier protein] reductase